MKYYGVRQNLIVPNVSNWSGLTLFETDILKLSQSGYATAVELKISKADLRNDLKKNHIKYFDRVLYNGKKAIEHYYQNFKYFYYAVPEFLKDEALKQIPHFAGLLVAKEEQYLKDGISHSIRIYEERKPKLLFNKKWNDKMRYDLARLGAMRILTLKENLNCA